MGIRGVLVTFFIAGMGLRLNGGENWAHGMVHSQLAPRKNDMTQGHCGRKAAYAMVTKKQSTKQGAEREIHPSRSHSE